jgi:hypothetical protein
VAIAILTGLLVIITGAYATFTYYMMRSAARTEKFNRQPILGIELVSAAPFPMEGSMTEPVVLLSVGMRNLGRTAALLHVEVHATLTWLTFTDKQSLFPLQIVPFLVPGEIRHIAFAFATGFETLFKCALAVRSEFSLQPNPEQGPLVDFGQNYPRVSLRAEFKNQYGDLGVNTAQFQLWPSSSPDDLIHEFIIAPADPSELIKCSWSDPSRHDLLKRDKTEELQK